MSENKAEPKTEIALVELPTKEELFTGETLDTLLKGIETEASLLISDVSTPAGRAQIKSNAYKVAQSKGLIDEAGKELVSGIKEKAKVIDAARRKARNFCDELKVKIRQPLTDYENAENARIQAIEDRYKAFTALYDAIPELIPDIEDRLKQFNSFEIPEGNDGIRFEEAREAGLKIITDQLDAAKERKAQLEELARLRAESEARIKADQEREAKEAAERAEREKVEREARIKAEAAEQAQREANEKAEKERLALEAKHKQELAEREAKAEAERKAIQEEAERKEREAREKAEAEEKERQRIAAEQERERLAKEAEVKRIEAEAEKQRQNKKHRDSIHRQAIAALTETAGSKEAATAIVKAIAEGLVPNITINY